MLKPALLYKEQILQKFTEFLYTEDYFYYSGYECGTTLPTFKEDDNYYCFASVDPSGRLIGFFSYRVNFVVDCVQQFGLFSFEKGNPILGRDVVRKMEELVSSHHRLEWSVIDGNPVKRHYDKFCKKHSGSIFHFHDCTKNLKGEYVDSFLYEIVKGESK